MRVINIIEIVDNNTQGIESFAVWEDQLSADVVDKAEELFIAKARENGFDGGRFDGADIIENGYYQNGNYSVNLVWSDI
jgi:hypothetical protein